MYRRRSEGGDQGEGPLAADRETEREKGGRVCRRQILVYALEGGEERITSRLDLSKWAASLSLPDSSHLAAEGSDFPGKLHSPMPIPLTSLTGTLHYL